MAESYPHIVLSQTGRSVKYTSAGGGGGSKYESPPRPARVSHGKSILDGLAQAKEQAEKDLASGPIGEGLQFIPMEFEQHHDFPMMLTQLEGDRLGVRIVNARTVGDRTLFTVAMPKSSVVKFAMKIEAYMSRDRANGTPLNENLAIGIASVNPVHLKEYWTGRPSEFPGQAVRLWWEVWLQTETEPASDVESWFRRTSAGLKLKVSDRSMLFPERLVVLAFATLDQWMRFPGLLQFLAEFRQANLIAGEFTRLTPSFQGELVRDLRSRLTPAPSTCASICILDTGVNRGHPLLDGSLSTEDTHSWQADWQSSDHDGHGTAMAGLALLGPLGEHILKPGKIALTHCLESVKILPPKGRNDPPDYAPITLGAMALAEIAAPSRSRVFSMAVTAAGHDNWQPTLWSAGLDQATSGQLDGKQRLIVVSAGNLEEGKIDGYPNENHVSSVEDPAQSWNAVTVGAYTDIVWDQTDGTQGYTALAPRGGLSPASRTSLTWSDVPWPYKPDIVFEGGIA